ncbi:Ctr-domain-containing protein [Amniculicola lignicola CBS 123094]|uniref:Copper transport protein n=1 Tax=Amniculicola lignicola CBS 123094 TaxID=1392246 RepID=A0A6A5WKC3_9PLEO|nr:Ctr-domain-containing protein [Amniculicola lignicola CBS 123094]
MDHSGMDMGSTTMAATMTGMSMPTGTAEASMADMMGGCQISMLWNWNTIDACFISESWHITSKGMFAGSCIGVILLVLSLEFLRRAGKEYDRYIIAQYTRSLPAHAPASSTSSHDGGKGPSASADAACHPGVAAEKFRPNILQQAIRALLHMLQFAVAYFVMLLAMYYNGYLIICIFIGAFIGYFIFGWESFNIKQGGNDRLQEEVTVCCG